VVGFFGPLEMYCFYLFSEGGHFYYEGFGFGSFMFGNIASQIIGYCLIAAVCVPLGYGHLATRRCSTSSSVFNQSHQPFPSFATSIISVKRRFVPIGKGIKARKTRSGTSA
jgi:hypothetical protein